MQCTFISARDHDLLLKSSSTIFTEVVEKVKTNSPHHVYLLGAATCFLLNALRQFYEHTDDEREGVKNETLEMIKDSITNWIATQAMVGGSSFLHSKPKDEIKVSCHCIL